MAIRAVNVTPAPMAIPGLTADTVYTLQYQPRPGQRGLLLLADAASVPAADSDAAIMLRPGRRFAVKPTGSANIYAWLRGAASGRLAFTEAPL